MYHVTERWRWHQIATTDLMPVDPRANAPRSTNPAGVYMFADLADLLSHTVAAELADPIVIAVDVRGLALHGDPEWINDTFPYPNTAWLATQRIPPTRLRALPAACTPRRQAGTRGAHTTDTQFRSPRRQPSMAAQIFSALAIKDESSDVEYHPYVSDDGRVGYVVRGPNGRTTRIYFNPSRDSDMGQANVFVYIGEHDDPALDLPAHFYDLDSVGVKPPDAEAAGATSGPGA
jgi:hypothetical protein